MEIRPLALTDLPELCDLLEVEVRGRMGYPDGLNREYFTAIWEHLILNDKSMAVVAEKDGKLNGWLLAIEGQDPYSSNPIALEQFWYVRPGRAGAITAMRLLDAFLKDAEERGCVRAMAGDWHPSGHQDLSRLYERKGFRQLERYFVRELCQ